MLVVALELLAVVVDLAENFNALVELRPRAGGLHDGAQSRAVHLVEEVAEAVVGLLLGLHVLLDRQLNLAEEDALEEHIYHDVPCALVQPVLDPDDLEGLAPVADALDLLEDADDLGLSGLDLAAEEVGDLEGDEIDIDVFDVLLVMVVHLLELLRNQQQDVDDLVEVGQEGGAGSCLYLGAEEAYLVLVLWDVFVLRALLQVAAEHRLDLVVVLLQLLIERVHFL